MLNPIPFDFEWKRLHNAEISDVENSIEIPRLKSYILELPGPNSFVAIQFQSYNIQGIKHMIRDKFGPKFNDKPRQRA